MLPILLFIHYNAISCFISLGLTMPAPNAQYNIQEIPLKIAGGTHYGRYPKISDEQTWNMIVSDGFLVPYAGYKNILTVDPLNDGRGIHYSSRGGFMIAVLGENVERINYSTSSQTFSSQLIGVLATGGGDVYINENNNSQIVITDGVNVYVYNWLTPTSPLLLSSATDFTFPFQNPGYVSFQNGRIIIACNNSTNWVLSGVNPTTLAQDATVWSTTAPFVGSLQSKPDFVKAAVPVPGGSNNLLVFGHNVAELWQDVGNALFPYQRNSSFSSDFGCINPSTIASLKNYIVWIAVNEQSGPVLMVMAGSQVESISTDGIDFTIGNLKNADNCTGFLFQQDGHVIYQFTFPDDNISYAYDFETKLFFNVSDENLSYQIAREVVYFSPTNNYYFVSLKGGNIYQFSSTFPDAEYYPDVIKPIPRVRITPPFRLPTQRMFIIKSLSFTIEQGQPNQVVTHTITDGADTEIITELGDFLAAEDGDILATQQDTDPIVLAEYVTSDAYVYLAISRNGAESFNSFWPKPMYPTGKFKNRFIYQRLGQANDATFQLRFVGPGRFVVTDGILEIYQ